MVIVNITISSKVVVTVLQTLKLSTGVKKVLISFNIGDFIKTNDVSVSKIYLISISYYGTCHNTNINKMWHILGYY